jgi:hypothetical protein
MLHMVAEGVFRKGGSRQLKSGHVQITTKKSGHVQIRVLFSILIGRARAQGCPGPVPGPVQARSQARSGSPGPKRPGPGPGPACQNVQKTRIWTCPDLAFLIWT